MTTKKIREAAEWVLKQSDNSEQDELLARFALEQTAEDGEIDGEFVKSFGFINDDTEEDLYLWAKDADECIVLRGPHVNGRGECRWFLYFNADETECWPRSITSHRQLSQLLTALGIQPKRKEAERCN